jgi:tetratricopeptide repeat protein 30
LIIQQTSPEDAFKKFDELSKKQIDQLRRLTKQVQDSRNKRDEGELKSALKEYDEALEKYIPVLMGQAKIYWDMENYGAVEKLFKQAVEYCMDHDVWKLNVAHTFYMQEVRFREAIRYYEPIVKKYQENVRFRIFSVLNSVAIECSSNCTC